MKKSQRFAFKPRSSQLKITFNIWRRDFYIWQLVSRQWLRFDLITIFFLLTLLELRFYLNMAIQNLVCIQLWHLAVEYIVHHGLVAYPMTNSVFTVVSCGDNAHRRICIYCRLDDFSYGICLGDTLSIQSCRLLTFWCNKNECPFSHQFAVVIV